jgi:hypothetical protein
MTAYRFRVKFDPDPTSLWRDIAVGADRTIAEFQSAINPAVGLDQGHLWFVGDDEGYWDSAVKYQCPQEYEESPGWTPARCGSHPSRSIHSVCGTDLWRYSGFDIFAKYIFAFLLLGWVGANEWTVGTSRGTMAPSSTPADD